MSPTIAIPASLRIGCGDVEEIDNAVPLTIRRKTVFRCGWFEFVISDLQIELSLGRQRGFGVSV